MAVKHQSRLPKLNRDANHRKALFRNQLSQLIENGSLTTSVTKAKVIKRLFDKLVTKAKKSDLSSRRAVIAALGNAKLANKLVDLITPAFGDRTSGFTRIQKVSVRRGDATPLATLQLVVPIPTPAEEKKQEVKEANTKNKKEVKKPASKVSKKAK